MREQKYLAVMAVLADGRVVSEVVAGWGVSRQSVHAWLRRYEEAGDYLGSITAHDRDSWPTRPREMLSLRRGRPGSSRGSTLNVFSDFVVAGGWLARAERLLGSGGGNDPERGWVEQGVALDSSWSVRSAVESQ